MAFIQLGGNGRDFTDPEGKFLFAYFCADEQTTTIPGVGANAKPRSGREDGNLVSFAQRKMEKLFFFSSSAAFVLVAARRISSATRVILLLPVCGSFTRIAFTGL